MHYISVIAMFKNETMNLKVWLEHYLWQGVDHFYLIDNGSTDNPMSLLEDYINRGIVSYHYWEGRHQQTTYIRQLFDVENLKQNTYWLIHCDLDEFFYGKNKKLKILLQELDQHANIIYCNWLMFGHENLIEHPDDIRKSIFHREPNKHVLTKCIFKPRVLNNSSQIELHSITDHPEDIGQRFTRVETEFIILNHYPIQSLKFFTEVKMKRGDGQWSHHENTRDMNYFHNYNVNCTYYDDVLSNLIINPPDGY